MEILIRDSNISFIVEKCFHENDAGMIGAVSHFIEMEKANLSLSTSL